ncbi:MAG: Rid family detoxifying hydrolase [Deltaproteobacteria bacterium]|nr:Rid family detoxifying hydrolase [Deltaproteobacteria bacterium]
MSARTVVHTDDAPAAIGPYSQAIIANGMVFTAGQIALDTSGQLVGDGDVAAETHKALKNLSAVLDAAGAGLDTVVKTTVFLADMGDFAAMNAVYAQYFEAPYPARAAVEAAALPKGVRVEVEAVALVR